MATPIEDMHHGRLDVGDVLRLPENYDLGPGSEPVDLLVYDPRDDEYGLGLMVVSGYKAGLIFSIFPRESRSLDNGLSCLRIGIAGFGLPMSISLCQSKAPAS